MVSPEREEPADDVPLFWPTAQTRFPETVTSGSKQNLPSRASSGSSVTRQLTGAGPAMVIMSEKRETLTSADEKIPSWKFRPEKYAIELWRHAIRVSMG